MSGVHVYLDTSALLKLYVAEAESQQAAEVVDQAEHLFTHLITYAELRATLAKVERMQRITAEDKLIIQKKFEHDWSGISIVTPNEVLIRRAGHLCDQFGLRGYDSVHLAAAEAISLRLMPVTLTFACFDKQLNRAAHALGMELL